MHPNQDHLEIEVKFFLKDPAAIRERLLSLGTVTQPRVFETNRRYEDSGRNLKRQGKLLRLRQDHECRLTFKSRSPRSDPRFKVYRELEVAVNDADTMAAILEALGFEAVQIYEKWRETFGVQTATVCIDTMPYGTFLEVEGSGEQITALVHKLGLPWEERILANYLAIFEVLRQKENLAFTDVTFDNFARTNAGIDPYIAEFYAGESA
jgi:adenylate cyclase class 2